MNDQKTDNRQAGELPSMFRCGYWMVFAALAVTILVLVAWGFAGRISINVNGHGMITGYGAYAGISSLADGTLTSIDVKPGDKVSNGQVVAHVFAKSDIEALRRARRQMEHYCDIYKQYAERVEKIKALRADYSRDELKRLDDSLERQRKQMVWYTELLARFPALAESGAVSRYEAQDAQDRYNSRLLQIDTDTASKLSEKYLVNYQIFEIEHDLFDFEVVAERARMELEEQLNLMNFRSCVFSACCGEVVNVNAIVGDGVRIGQELMRVMVTPPQGAEIWEAYTYFSAVEAKDIVPGMEALVVPSVVRVEEDGAIRGFVASVGKSIETEESITSTFRSAGYARTLCVACSEMPVRVNVILVRDSSTPSGFSWTSGKGPDIDITQSSPCFVSVRTASHSPMQILLGRARRAVFGDGIERSEHMKELSLRTFGRENP